MRQAAENRVIHHDSSRASAVNCTRGARPANAGMRRQSDFARASRSAQRARRRRPGGLGEAVAEGRADRGARRDHPDGRAYHGDADRRSPDRGQALRPRAHHALVGRQRRPVNVLRVEQDEQVTRRESQEQAGYDELSVGASRRLSAHHGDVLSRACAAYDGPSSRRETDRHRDRLSAYFAGAALSTLETRPEGPWGFRDILAVAAVEL